MKMVCLATALLTHADTLLGVGDVHTDVSECVADGRR